MSEVRNRPKLRFSGFDHEWQQSKLGADTKVLMCKRIFSEDTSEDGDVPFYKIGTIGRKPDAFITKELFEEFRTSYNYPRVGEILITCSGTVGKCVVFDGTDSYYQDSNIVWIDNPNQNIRNEFLYYILSNLNWSKLNSTTIARIYGDDLRNLEIVHPTGLVEQLKIAKLFSTIDSKLNLFQQKKALLEKYKKGMMQKIFNQEFRFKDENGKDFGEWKEKTLGEVAIVQMGQSPESTSYNDQGIGFPLIQGNADIANRKTFVRIWTTQLIKKCEVGDLILTVRAPVGSVAKSIHQACIGRGVCSIINKDNSTKDFLYQFLLYFEPQWKSIEQGSTFTAVSGDDIKKIQIPLPTLDEQTKVANCLSAIDDKKNLVAVQIEKMEKFKKGLLEEMFV